jgi:hypothetical protein
MKNKVWIKIFDSFSSAEQSDTDYYLSMSSKERLETVQFLREEWLKIKKGPKHEGRKRLRRIIQVIEQP